MSMIGNKESRKQIEELLHKIAKQNNEKYGHMLDDTDCDNTEIHIGYYKHDYDENRRYHLRFDIFSGDFIDTEGDYSRYMWGNYFELSDDFEENMKEKLKSIEDQYEISTQKAQQTIKRLQKLVSE